MQDCSVLHGVVGARSEPGKCTDPVYLHRNWHRANSELSRNELFDYFSNKPATDHDIYLDYNNASPSIRGRR